MKGKTKLLATAMLVAALSATSAGAMIASAAEDDAQDPPAAVEPAGIEFAGHTWTGGKTWTKNEGADTVTNTNTGFTGGYLLTTDDNLYGDYSVSATFQGTIENVSLLEVNVNVGIVPWYQDAQNYVISYLEWWPSKGNHPIAVQTLYVENGKLSNWTNSFLDNLYATSLYTLELTDVLTISVDKTYVASTGLDQYRVTISGTNKQGAAQSETPSTESYAISVPHSAEQAQAGLYSMTDSVTFSDFSTRSLTDTGVYKKVEGADGVAAKSTASNGWSYADDAYTVDATSGTSLQNQAVLPNEIVQENYKISYTAAVTGEGTNKELSVLPYFADTQNFVRFVLKQTAGGATVNAEGVVEGVAFAEDPVTVSQSVDWSSVTFGAGKKGTAFTAYLGEEEICAYSNAILLNGARVAIGAGNCSATFANVYVEKLDYTAYDWFDKEGYFVSAATKNSVTFTEDEDENVTITLKSPVNAENYTRLYQSSNKYNQVGIEGKFIPAEDAEYGLYVNYTSETKYVKVVVQGGGITLTAVNGDDTVTETFDLSELPAPVEDNYKTLRVGATFGDVTVMFNGTEVITCEVPWLAEVEVSNVGALAKGGEVSVQLIVDGFEPYVWRDDSGWRLSGARIGSWEVTENGVKGNPIGGTGFERTIAIMQNVKTPAQGYFVSAEIKVTELTETEWKTGILPYYKDGSNFIFVWLDQRSGQETKICVTATLNGKTIGAQWRETPIAYTMLNAVNMMEIEVAGDALKIYLNKSYAPVYATTIDGLSNAALGYIGMNVFNTSAEFNNIKVTEKRAQIEEGEPTIEIIGTMPTSGETGTEIRLPVLSATGVGGATANVVVTVTDRDGEVVTVTNNRFTPLKAGKYTVTVTATDAWGNVTEKPYEITVTGEDKTTDGGKDGSGSNVGLIVGLSIGGAVLVGAAAAVTVILLKKRKNKN